MKTLRLYYKLIFFIPVLLLSGCLATSQRSAKTLKKGQFSTAISNEFQYYSELGIFKNKEPKGYNFLSYDLRYGVGGDVDFGIRYSDNFVRNYDLYNSLIADIKIQTSDGKKVNGSIFSINIGKGLYNDFNQHITYLGIMPGIKRKNYVLNLLIQANYLSRNFLSKAENIELLLGFNLEYNLIKEDRNKWIPKLGFSGGIKGAGFFLNIGFSIDSPY